MKTSTHTVRRVFWALVFFVGLSLARASGAAAEAPVTWEPFGYALLSDMDQTDLHIWPALYSFSKDQAGTCNWSRTSGRSLNYCPDRAEEPFYRSPYCTGLPKCQGVEEYDERIAPVCRNFPISATWPRDAVSYIGMTRQAAKPLDYLCSCPAGTIPDVVAGFCLSKRELYLTASRTRYIRKEAGKPILLDVFVRRAVSGDRGVPDEPVSFSVQSSTGQAGTVLPSTGRTLADGTFHAEYRFPAFTKS